MWKSDYIWLFSVQHISQSSYPETFLRDHLRIDFDDIYSDKELFTDKDVKDLTRKWLQLWVPDVADRPIIIRK
jgi:hypothetical protein